VHAILAEFLIGLHLRQANGESPPGVLYGHGVVAVGASLVVFGGWDGRNATNNTYILDCASLFQ